MRSIPNRAGSLPLVLLASLLAGLAGPLSSVAAAQVDEELEELLAEERVEADRLRRRGRGNEALSILSEHLADGEIDPRARSLRARVYLDDCRYDRAESNAERAHQNALAWTGPGGSELLAEAARVYAEVLLELGRGPEALAALEESGAALDPAVDARDALVLAQALRQSGRREEAQSTFELGTRTPSAEGGQGWRGLLAKARCQRELGWIERASYTLQEADQLARAEGEEEPDVLVALGDLFFEAYREVAESGSRSAQAEYKSALEHNPSHQGALLGLFEIHRYNGYLHNSTAGEFLERLLNRSPESVEGQLAAARADLEDGKLLAARERIERLEALAGGRRDVRSVRAALHWIVHEREQSESLIAELLEGDPGDSVPEREVGRHLLELYRFAEGLPFLQRAVERDVTDHRAWTELGRALANTGDESAALDAFERAEHHAQLRQDAWRANIQMVLRRIQQEHVTHEERGLSFSWRPDAAPVFLEYLPSFYQAAREEFAQRYGYTAPETHIEVFRRMADFSVRSTGFEGFPALGVCFGPVVTSVSPISELRGNFSWAETAFHEYSHVVHLGLSHNRCPRWITEGLATWEEVNANPAWTRNMRRELLSSWANEDLIRVRDLNRAFRTSRILFAYYQGGLLCEMLIDEHGFSPMVRLLEAFDRGADLDSALGEVFGKTPEELDADFEAFVALRLAELREEPQWSERWVARLRLETPAEPESQPPSAAWQDAWCTAAWAAFQHGRRVDAEESLRKLARAGVAPPRASFLRGFIAVGRGDDAAAEELFRQGIADGGDSFAVRTALASFERERDDWEAAAEELRAAEACFPGYPEAPLSAELALAIHHDLAGDEEQAMRARERWLRWNSGNDELRLRVGRWHLEGERWEEAARYLREANEVDPFRRSLHRDWAHALVELERPEEALRELRVAAAVPPDLDADGPRPMARSERATLDGLRAQALLLLGRVEEARERVTQALELDEDNEFALAAQEGLGE